MWENTIRSKIGDIIQLTDGLKLKIDKKKKKIIKLHVQCTNLK